METSLVPTRSTCRTWVTSRRTPNSIPWWLILSGRLRAYSSQGHQKGRIEKTHQREGPSGEAKADSQEQAGIEPSGSAGMPSEYLIRPESREKEKRRIIEDDV